MEFSEKTKWLGRYQTALSRERFLEGEIETLRSDAERMTVCMSGMPGRGGVNADRLPRAVERLEEAREKLENQLEICVSCRCEITQAISLCANETGREVLRRRYIVGESYGEIASAMGLVERRVYQVHRSSVQKLDIEGMAKECAEISG